MRPHRWQPTRLPHPWDSLGKNTGVGCHFLLQCMKVKSQSEVIQLCLTLTTPWTAAHQAPPSMGFSRQEYWSGVPVPSPPRKHYLGIVSECSIAQSLLILATPWTAACQASRSFTISQSLLKLMSIESVILSDHLSLCCLLLLLPSTFPSIRVFFPMQRVSSFHQKVKVLELQLQHQSFQ